MADYGEILKDGVWQLKHISEVTESDSHCPIRCPGENDIRLCHADMGVSMQNGKPHYYYQLHHDGKVHIPGCNYNKRAEKTRISHIDTSCHDRDITDIFEGMRERQIEKNPTPPRGSEDNENNQDQNGVVPEEEITKAVEKVKSPPSTVSKLADVFQKLSIRDIFAQGRVKDYVIDYRTVDYYREHGIPENRPMLVLLSTIKRRNMRISDPAKWELVFADCTYNPLKRENVGDCIQFRVRDFGARQELRARINKKKLTPHHLVLFCMWQRDPNNRNTYIAIRETAGVVGSIAVDQCQTPFAEK